MAESSTTEATMPDMPHEGERHAGEMIANSVMLENALLKRSAVEGIPWSSLGG